MNAAYRFVVAHLEAKRTIRSIAAPTMYRTSLWRIDGVVASTLIPPALDRAGQIVITDLDGEQWAAVLPAEAV